MKNKVVFRLGSSFLCNAGLVGLIDFLNSNNAIDGIDYEIDGQSLYISSNYLLNNNIPQMFIDTTSELLGHRSKVCMVIDSIFAVESILANDTFTDDEKAKKLKPLYDSAVSLFAKKSFQNGVIYVNEKPEYEAVSLELCGKFKISKDIKEKAELLKEICMQIEKNKDIKSELVFRDLISFQFKLFYVVNSTSNVMTAYNGIKAQSVADFYKEKYFQQLVDTISKKEEEQLSLDAKITKKLAKSKKKSYIRCIECMEQTSNPTDISFVADTTDDMGRKKSSYWNCLPDAYICEKCAFLYTFVPLGFAYLGQEAVFINDNSSINGILGSMELLRSKASDDSLNDKVMLYKAFIKEKTEALENKINNIQVVSKGLGANHFSMSIIGKDMVKKLGDSSKHLESIEKVYVKVENEYINVFNEVFGNILSHRSQYRLIHRLLHISLDKNMNTNYLISILKIHLIFRGGENVENLMKNANTANMCGKEMRYKIAGNVKEKDVDNSLRGYVYKLNNAVSVNNREMFLDSVIRIYSGCGLPIPSVFMKCFESNEMFKAIGQGYVLGLKYQKYEKTGVENEEERNNG